MVNIVQTFRLLMVLNALLSYDADQKITIKRTCENIYEWLELTDENFTLDSWLGNTINTVLK